MLGDNILSVQRWGGSHGQREVAQEEVVEESRHNPSSTDKKRSKKRK
jgi:hypothetical protein